MNKYEHIFENAPIAILEEDWSGVKEIIDSLRPKVKPDEFPQYLQAHPELLVQLIEAIRVLRVNKKAEEIFESEFMTPETTSLREIYYPESFENIIHAVIDIYCGEKELEIKMAVKTFKGNKLHVINHIKFAEDDLNWNNVIVSIMDITQREKDQEQYVESQKKFYKSFYQGVVGMIFMNVDGDIIDVNDSFCQFIGYDKDELLNMNVQQIETENNKGVMHQDISNLIHKDRDFLKDERTFRRKDFEEVWAFVGLSLMRDKDNNPLYFIGQIVDIDQEKKNAIILQGNVDKYKKLLNSAQTIFTILDIEGGIVDCSDTFIDFMDCERPCLKSKSLRALVSTESMHVFDNAWDRIIEGQTVNCVEVAITKGSVFKWVSISGSMIRNGGEKIFLLMSDITERKRREFEKQIVKEKHRDRLRNNIKELRDQIGSIGTDNSTGT